MTEHNITEIAILGSTGSIGTQTLDVINEHPDLFHAFLLCANSNWQLLAKQALTFKPQYVVIANPQYLPQLQSALQGSGIKVLSGHDALEDLVTMSCIDIVVAAMVGYSGLRSVISAAKAGKCIALANKETLVAAGNLVTNLCRLNNAVIRPVDSEHSAIFQCLVGEDGNKIHKILLTASGGPFRTFREDQLEHVTPTDALNHPNWNMGRKVTIDSATMMNKGFEMIEAHWLFNTPASDIEIIVHPQSVIHSMVEFTDGSIKAQLGIPDMRIPISYALGFPTRLSSEQRRLNIQNLSTLTFEPADTEKFPMLAYAFDALARGGTAPAILAAADEIAVDAFLNNRIGFMDISRLVKKVLDNADIENDATYEAIMDADSQGRLRAHDILKKI